MNEAIAIEKGQGRRYSCAPNEQMTFLLSGAETGQFDLAESTVGYLAGPPLHKHDRQDEIHYVLSGKLQYQIGSEELILEAGSCVFLPKRIPHSWINLQQEPARVLIVLTPGGSEGFFKTLAELPSERLDFETLSALGQQYGAEIVGPPLSISLGFI